MVGLHSKGRRSSSPSDAGIPLLVKCPTEEAWSQLPKNEVGVRTPPVVAPLAPGVGSGWKQDSSPLQ